MRVLIFGAGAVGQLFGARLHRAGHEVLLVARTEDVVAIRARGLRVEGVFEGNFPVPAVDALVDGLSTELLLLTTKSFDVESAGREIALRLRPPPPILAIQNGIGIEEHLRQGLGSAAGAETPVLRGVHTVPATRLGPGSVRQPGEGEMRIGTPSDPAGRGAADRFVELLRSGGIPTQQIAGIEREVWKKLLVNSAVNPVTADHGIVNGQLARDPWRGQAETLLYESLQVARAEGVEIPEEEALAALWKVVRETAQNRSSMLQDLSRHRRTEIEEISGEILRRGESHGLRLPATRRIVERIRARSAPGSVEPPNSEAPEAGKRV